jgi:DNA-directed RNA polymerase beta subunit
MIEKTQESGILKTSKVIQNYLQFYVISANTVVFFLVVNEIINIDLLRLTIEKNFQKHNISFLMC